MTQQETDLELPMSVQESPAEVWVGGGPAGLGALSVAVHAQNPLKEVSIIFITSTTVRLFGLRSNNRKGTQPRPSTENWIKGLLSMALPIRKRPSFCSVTPIRKLP